MFSHLLSLFIISIQSFSGNNTGSKLLLITAGIVSILAIFKAMRQQAKAANQKMTNAQRKEMRKLKWKMITGTFKKKKRGDGETGMGILGILALILMIGGFIALIGLKLTLLLIVLPMILLYIAFIKDEKG